MKKLSAIITAVGLTCQLDCGKINIVTQARQSALAMRDKR